MGKSRDALGLVLDGLRRRLAEGSIAPGALVGIADTAEAYRTSVTPVREALARLAGEGLLTGTRRLGFVRPRLDAEELCELYSFHEALVIAAVRLTDPPGLGSVEVRADPAAPAEPLFAALSVRAHNRPLARARHLAAQALGGVLRAERLVFTDLALEAQGLWAVAKAPRAEGLLSQIAAYHERRRRYVHDLLRAETASSPAGRRDDG